MPSEAEEASWRHLHPGSRVLLWYEGDTVWHERMLLAATCEDQSEWMMVTPDSDVHYESFRTDVSRVIVLPDGGVRPPLNDPVYGFADAIGMEAARGLIADGLNEAIRRGVELGATPPEHSLLVTWDGQRVPLRTPLGPGADARMDDRTDDPREVHSGDATPRGQALDPSLAQDGAWHVTDFSKKIAHGVSIARLPGGSVLLGSRALGRFNGEEVALEWVRTVDFEEWLRLQQEAASRSNGTAGPSAQDARVLAVETLRTGERSRTFASAVASMEQIEMSDWPIRGPRTALWLMRFIQTYGSGPLSRHTKWRSETHPPAGNALVAEHEMISEVLERASVFDQLDVPNLSSFECLCRRYQAIEETLRPNEPEAPIEGMEHFMGRPRLSGGVAMSPDLSRYVADQLALETSVLKERRKAREERAAKPRPKAAK